MDIIDAVQKSAHRYNSPDDFFGYGLPNFRKAYNFLMAQSFTATFSYLNGVLSLKWNMKADSSVRYVIERKSPGSNQFTRIDSILTLHDALMPDSYEKRDTLHTTIVGLFAYRIKVVIGKDTSFIGPGYTFANQWPALVADSLKIATSFTNCVADINWSMRDDSLVVYELERQLPGTNAFAQVKTFKGSGSYQAGITRSYSYKDPISTALKGSVSYRLKVSLGQDTSFYSKVSSFASLMPCYDREGYFFTPSPFDNYVLAMMNTSTAASRFHIIIYDVNGRIVHRVNGSKPAGFYHVQVPTYNLAHGVYFASILIDNKTVYRQKIVK